MGMLQVCQDRELKNRKFWLYPVVVPIPKITYKIWNGRGSDAYIGSTQLIAVESPNGS
ncbi:unnamed protein product (macronuclear) [Paramecium tetraurelia]|uniref:Uncharacterized protein n=1 Tax=Paramecium tetraurelia TaxID=5888 RepID=A0BZU0_PARTE|nr:uncharacterized protein GSPATT00005909001 [Paramecium tetraurelia]CAK64057.1 unnamed protein product [Paramecium tetraurelia]|eukprot:XP_001431455.1 hypothetical protein (macronuclear) [Paramecium tetraurelia strain d4-2]